MKIGILGASGAVGREMIKILEERNFPVSELRLFSSARSAGQTLTYKGAPVRLSEAREDSFDGLDVVLGAAQNPVAKYFAPFIVRSGAVFIDNSSAFRMEPDVPLIVPEINPEDTKKHAGIISNPNCSTIITLTGVNAIHKLSPITDMVVSTYQATSGAGQAGPVELRAEEQAIFTGETVTPSVFAHRIAENLIPCIGSPSTENYTTEEMKLQNEGRKILHAPELLVSCTCVRVPVFRSHSISALVHTKDVLPLETVRAALAEAPGVRLTDDLESGLYPMPLDTSDQNLVFVGRIRKDLTRENGINLFMAGDQIRKGAATNAVQIAELLN